MNLNTIRKNIYLRMGLIVLAGIIIPALIMGGIEYKTLEKQLLKKTHQHVNDASKLMASSLSRPLWDYSELTADSIVRATLNDDEIVKVKILDNYGGPFYSIDNTAKFSTLDTDKIFFIERQINHNNKLIGKVQVFYTTIGVYKTLNGLLLHFMITRILQLLFTLGTVLAFLNLGFLKRINKLSHQAKKLDQQILDQPFDWEHGDPIDELGRELENARNSLNKLFNEVKIKNDELFNLNQELELKVKEKTQQVVHAARMAALGEMAAGVAHEINNPLTVIMATSKTIDNGLCTNRYTKEDISIRLKKIITMSDRIDKIVKGLRSFSGHPEKEKMHKVPLAQIINETLVLCQERLKNNNITLYLSPMPEIEIECRSVQISQVLLNLINNASDAIKNLEEKWINIEFQIQPNETLQMRVTDSGNGIAPEIAVKIMQPFFTTKDSDRGTGLGLSISSGIIEDHHGRLWLDQNAEHTSFVVQMPILNPEVHSTHLH